MTHFVLPCTLAEDRTPFKILHSCPCILYTVVNVSNSFAGRGEQNQMFSYLTLYFFPWMFIVVEIIGIYKTNVKQHRFL